MIEQLEKIGGLAIQLPSFFAYIESRCGWFRVFGFGLHWKDNRFHPPLFSERNGLAKRLHVGPWSIGVLTRRSLPR